MCTSQSYRNLAALMRAAAMTGRCRTSKAAHGCGRVSASRRVSVHSWLSRTHRWSSVDAFLQSVHRRVISPARSQAATMPVAIASNYVSKPTAEGLLLRSNLAAGGGLTRR
jgi:hypothetical protein